MAIALRNPPYGAIRSAVATHPRGSGFAATPGYAEGRLTAFLTTDVNGLSGDAEHEHEPVCPCCAGDAKRSFPGT